ncbi:MAG: hypothetical protein NVS4B6_13810 [Mycobacterium sp.]
MHDDTHHQVIKPIRPIGVGNDDTHGSNAAATISKPSQSTDPVAQSVEALGSGPQESAQLAATHLIGDQSPDQIIARLLLPAGQKFRPNICPKLLIWGYCCHRLITV